MTSLSQTWIRRPRWSPSCCEFLVYIRFIPSFFLLPFCVFGAVPAVHSLWPCHVCDALATPRSLIAGSISTLYFHHTPTLVPWIGLQVIQCMSNRSKPPASLLAQTASLYPGQASIKHPIPHHRLNGSVIKWPARRVSNHHLPILTTPELSSLSRHHPGPFPSFAPRLPARLLSRLPGVAAGTGSRVPSPWLAGVARLHAAYTLPQGCAPARRSLQFHASAHAPASTRGPHAD